MVYIIYVNGKQFAKFSKWKTVISHVREQRMLGNHGAVHETYPNKIKPDLFIMGF